MIYSKRHSGQIVMEALEHLAEPATITDITKRIAIRWRFDAAIDLARIRKIVRQTVHKGVQFGFIMQVKSNRYTTIGIILKNDQRHIDEDMKMMYDRYVI